MVKPTQSASLRTRNRIREHGPLTAIGEAKTVAFDRTGHEWVPFTSDDGWMGWLPVGEFEPVEAS